MSIETELKLQIEPRHLARLRDHPLLKHARERATRQVYSVYYDTPGLDLWRAGVALRLRRIGTRWIQTIKGGGHASGGLHERREIEIGITAPVPNFSVLDNSDFAALFAPDELRARLQPLIVTDLTRTTCVLSPAAGVTLEASIDCGHVKSGNATAPICELELEVKAGPAWRAFQVALQLLESVPLLVDDRSKAERGIALHLAAPVEPRKSMASPLNPGMSCNDAFKALLLTCIAHYGANQRGLLDGADPEYLHQLRVALRRLRSVFSIFAPLFPPAVLAPPVAEARWLARTLGAARDWDVFVAETLPPVTAHYTNHAGIAGLTRAAARLRAASTRQARRAVRSARGQGLLLSLGAWISAETWLEAFDDARRSELNLPVAGFAQSVLDAALGRVRRRGRNFARLAPADLHRLRIAAKKLRYATEFFAPLFDGKATHDYRAVLARLQEALGAYNDAVKMTQLAQRAGRALRGAPANEAHGIMLGWSAGMQHAGTRHLRHDWKEFRKAAPFWK